MMSEESAPELPTWNEMQADNKLRRCIPTPERELDVPRCEVITANNDRFATAVNYPNYRYLNKVSLYDDDVEHELHRMAKKIAVQMKDRTFPGKDPSLVIAFYNEFKSLSDECGVPEDVAKRLFKQCLADPAKAAVKARLTLRNPSNFHHDGASRSYSTVD